MASSKTYRIVTLTTSVPHNIVSGTTAAAPIPWLPADKGVEVTFQNQSTTATNIYLGDSTLAISIGATSTTGAGGIMLAQNGSYSLGKRSSVTGIQLADWYVVSTSSNAVCVAQLLKAV